MFLVRRREDGMYYRHLPYGQRYGKDPWSRDPQECRPYRTTGAAKQSVRSFCYVSWQERKGMAGPCCYNGSTHYRYCKDHIKAFKKLETERFDQQFELVPVRVTMELVV